MLNSLLVFLMISFLIEGILFAFRIKNPRMRYVARLLPIIKLPFDLLSLVFFEDLLFFNLNPFSCEVYLQKFLTKFLPIGEKWGASSTVIPEYIANLLPPILLTFLVTFSVALSCYLFAKKTVQTIRSVAYVKGLLRQSTPCEQAIVNETLKDNLSKAKALIHVSEQVPIPFVADSRNIFLPKNLMEILSQEEFEAVIAHELEHVKWKDPIVRLSCHVICAFFWWIPTKWLLKRLEDDQEQASDLKVSKYGIDNHAFGSAFVKTISNAKYLKIQMAAICPFASPSNAHKARLENILNWDP